MNGDPNGNSESSNGLKRKYDGVEYIEDAPVQTKCIKDENEICAICQDDLSHEDASKACPNSDKHDFHKECLAT